MLLKILVRKIRKQLRHFLGIQETLKSDTYIEYLRQQGCMIGKRVVFFSPKSTLVDITRPWLIEIGDDVQIPYGVSILTHGYDWAVLKGKYGDILGSSGKVKIGNNVFIGANSMVLKGTTIGDNVIIGGGALSAIVYLIMWLPQEILVVLLCRLKSITKNERKHNLKKQRNLLMNIENVIIKTPVQMSFLNFSSCLIKGKSMKILKAGKIK